MRTLAAATALAARAHGVYQSLNACSEHRRPKAPGVCACRCFSVVASICDGHDVCGAPCNSSQAVKYLVAGDTDEDRITFEFEISACINANPLPPRDVCIDINSCMYTTT